MNKFYKSKKKDFNRGKRSLIRITANKNKIYNIRRFFQREFNMYYDKIKHSYYLI